MQLGSLERYDADHLRCIILDRMMMCGVTEKLRAYARCLIKDSTVDADTWGVSLHLHDMLYHARLANEDDPDDGEGGWWDYSDASFVEHALEIILPEMMTIEPTEELRTRIVLARHDLMHHPEAFCVPPRQSHDQVDSFVLRDFSCTPWRARSSVSSMP